MKRGRFEIRKRTMFGNWLEDDEFYSPGPMTYYWWVYIAPNGEIVCSSERLESEAAARKGIASIKRGIFSRIVVAE